MRGALAWAARNPVFANLLMGFLIAAGLFASVHLVREMFPEFSFDTVTVTVVYAGATPEEIERGITLKVEEAIEALEGIRKIESTSSEGVCVVRAEIDDTLIDPADALTRIRNAVDEITTLPEDAERPRVELAENRREVASIVLAADVDEASLAALARELEAQLLALPGVREVTIEGLREREIAIECDEAALQRHGLDLDAVARAVAQANLELPLGTLRTEREERLLRVAALREHASQLADIPVLERPDGTVVRLGEVAQLRDGFVLEPGWARLDGKRAVRFAVLRSKSADTIELAGRIKGWIEQRRHALPEGVRLLLWRDGARSVVERLELLGRNGLQGLALVFGILLLFLGWRLSFWVAFGLPVAFLTTLLLLWWVGATLNMITSFALIMVLGILVDDSIVVAENIARHMRERGHTVAAAVSGLLEVAWPVVASVTTTVLAFVPLFFIGGTMGKFIRIMPVAVVACLLASLIEALLILPAHLAHSREPASDRVGRRRPLHALHVGTERLLRRFVEGPFRRSLAWAIRWRYVVAALAFAFVVVVGGLAAGGRPPFVFFPRLDTEFVDAQLRMPVGTAIGVTDEVVRRLEHAGERLREELPLADDGAPIVRNVFSLASGPGTATVVLRLSPSQLRSVTGLEIVKRWRALAGELGQAQSVVFSTGGHRPGGHPIELQIRNVAPREAATVVARVRAALAAFPGVFGITDNLAPGKREIRFEPTPVGRAAGLTPRELARQLFASYRGLEVQRLQRGRDEVVVRVRRAAPERVRLAGLETLWLPTPRGARMPLVEAARTLPHRSLGRIERSDGQRVVTVFADVDDAVANANEIVADVRARSLPAIAREHPGLRFAFGGAQQEQAETLRELFAGFFIALFAIFTVLALLFDNYVQPAIVMGVVPVALAGAVLGHAVFGQQLMLFSLFGMIGLTGIVVNDALVLVDFFNRARERGLETTRAVLEAGCTRFRPVFLTTATTVAGLTPLLLERSLQARFLIPMALSIAAGVSVATVITLYLVPSATMIVEDVRALGRRLWRRERPAAAAVRQPG